MLFRTLVSAILVGTISFGNGIQTIMQDGNVPTKWQFYSVLAGSVVLFLNDIKSRLTPTNDK